MAPCIWQIAQFWLERGWSCRRSPPNPQHPLPVPGSQRGQEQGGKGRWVLPRAGRPYRRPGLFSPHAPGVNVLLQWPWGGGRQFSFLPQGGQLPCPIQALGWGPTWRLSALAPSSVTGAHTSASLSLSFPICKTEKNHSTPSPLPLATRYGPASASGGSPAGPPYKVEGAACARLQKAAWVRSRGHTQQGPRLQKTQDESPALLHLPGFWSRLIPPQERSRVSHPCALGPERSAPCPGSRSVSPEDGGPLQSPLHYVSPVRDGGPSALFCQHGPCSVALGSHHPPSPSGSPTPKRNPGVSLSHREFPCLKLWAHRTDYWPGGQGA